MSDFARQQHDLLSALYSGATRLIHACIEPDAIEQASLRDRAAALNAVSRIMRMFQKSDKPAAPTGPVQIEWDFGEPNPADAEFEHAAGRVSAVKSVSPGHLHAQVRPVAPVAAPSGASQSPRSEVQECKLLPGFGVEPRKTNSTRAGNGRPARQHPAPAPSPARSRQSIDRPRGMRAHDLVAPHSQPLEQRDQRDFA